MRLFLINIISLFICFSSMAQSDTLNQIDENYKKTGYWIIYGKNKPGFDAYGIMEEGRYLSGRRDGFWIQYYPTGKIKSKIKYFNGRPVGKFTLYYETGKIEEQGTWSRVGYVDTFQRYHPNGTLAQQRYFNILHRSEGWQYWYDENGELELKFFARDGQEVLDSGMVSKKKSNDHVLETPTHHIYEVFSNEELCLCNIRKLEYPYISNNDNGDTIVSYSTAYYFVKLMGEFKGSRLFNGMCYIEIKNEENKLVVKNVEEGKLSYSSTSVSQKVKDQLKFTKQYNSNKLLEYDGYFEQGEFYEGKQYIYDENGLLKQIKVYKNGMHIGNAPLN